MMLQRGLRSHDLRRCPRRDEGAAPITRGPKGYRMLGYLDGSVEVWKTTRLGARIVERYPAGWGSLRGFTDWQPEEESMK